MNDRLRLIGPTQPSGNVPPPIHPAALRVRGRIATAMLALHALSPEDAVGFTPEPREAREFDRLRAAGIVREVPGGRYWYDLVAYHVRDRARSRTAMAWTVAIAVTLAALLPLFYRG